MSGASLATIGAAIVIVQLKADTTRATVMTTVAIVVTVMTGVVVVVIVMVVAVAATEVVVVATGMVDMTAARAINVVVKKRALSRC